MHHGPVKYMKSLSHAVHDLSDNTALFSKPWIRDNTYLKIGSPFSWFIVIFIYKSNWTYYEWKLYWIRQRYMICVRPSPHPYAYIWIILQSVLQYGTVRHIIMCWDFNMDWQNIQLYPSRLEITLQTNLSVYFFL
jgi:hypothetical protein